MSLMFPNATIRVRAGQTRQCMSRIEEFLSGPKADSIDSPKGDDQNPPLWLVNFGSFTVEGVAIRSSDDRWEKVIINGVGDPTFWGTSRLTTELAVALATKGPPQNRRGFLTPALAVDINELEQRWRYADKGRFIAITREHMGT